MLIPVWAKATETQHSGTLLRDEKALEIMNRIDYDFSKFSKAKLTQVGTCVRASLIDNEVKDFISKHPDGLFS